MSYFLYNSFNSISEVTTRIMTILSNNYFIDIKTAPFFFQYTRVKMKINYFIAMSYL